MSIKSGLTKILEWYKELPRCITRLGGREDDSDKPLSERSSAISIQYGWNPEQQGTIGAVQLEASGLIDGDEEKYTLEGMFGYSPKDFNEIPSQDEAVTRKLKKGLPIEFNYQKGQNPRISIGCRELSDISLLQDHIDLLAQLETYGDISTSNSLGFSPLDALKSLEDRTNKISIGYNPARNQQTGKDYVVMQVQGLNPFDYHAFTIEGSILGYGQKDFRDIPNQQEPLRALRESVSAKAIEIQIQYPSHDKAIIYLTTGELGSPDNVKQIMDRLVQLDSDTKINMYRT